MNFLRAMKESRYVREGEERVLALYFNSIGFGYSLMMTPVDVMEKGVVGVGSRDNKEVMGRVRRLVRRTRPERIVIEDHKARGTHKSKRIVDLLRRTKRLAGQRGIPLSTYSRQQVRMVFAHWDAKSRYEIVEVIARNVGAFEDVFFDRPRYPRIEHFRSSIFDAASFAIAHYYITH